MLIHNACLWCKHFEYGIQIESWSCDTDEVLRFEPFWLTEGGLSMRTLSNSFFPFVFVSLQSDSLEVNCWYKPDISKLLELVFTHFTNSSTENIG